ncbi:hypothetical protein [Mycolicibacterium llatzerense]|nr:hypothetical protein [Mycolicibacterium llatzerense]
MIAPGGRGKPVAAIELRATEPKVTVKWPADTSGMTPYVVRYVEY